MSEHKPGPAPEFDPGAEPNPQTWLDGVILWCMRNQLIVGMVLALLLAWGAMVAPFDWDIPFLPRSPVSVDAIPDLGENQQIVFVDWMGRSPQNVEDQITYPLTTALLGLPGVKTIRSTSMFGFAQVNAIFEEGVDFYWARSRVLEKLNALPPNTLPEGVVPVLGPDATGLGQIFWYTLEGRDPEGNPTPGWDPQELRSVQDWYVRYALASAHGVSEVASAGGMVSQYQIDVNPEAMRAYGITLDMVLMAVEKSNLDVGASTLEVNRVEYVVRGLGFLRSLEDLEQVVVMVNDNVPVTIGQIATVARGPAPRVGVLDKAGADAAGGVVVSRFGANPLETIKNVKAKIAEISPGLPSKPVFDAAVPAETIAAFAAEQGFAGDREGWAAWLKAAPRAEWPAWVTLSQVAIVPFYDRTGLIRETLGTLEDALVQQVLITIVVVLFMAMHLRSSILVSAMMPLAILVCFIGMKLLGVQANVVSLAGIAIAIGTLVDMGIILCENIVRHLEAAPRETNRFNIVYNAASEVGGAVVAAVATTIIGFFPVFTMTGAEGKMFQPLAYTKTLCLTASVVLAITIMPTFCYYFIAREVRGRVQRMALGGLAAAAGAACLYYFGPWIGVPVIVAGLYQFAAPFLPDWTNRWAVRAANIAAMIVVGYFLTMDWLPLGPAAGALRNGIFVGVLVVGLLGFFHAFRVCYPAILGWCLAHKLVYIGLSAGVLVFGWLIWLGADRLLGWLPESIRQNAVYAKLYHGFPGLGKEFMPPLDEGSFLYMPTTMPHASLGEALDALQIQDKAIAAIPEIDSVVGKIGRAESALDPAPISMVETVINYKPEYLLDEDGRRRNFRYDPERGAFARDAAGNLIPDEWGRPFRQWRDHIKSPDGIWQEIVKAAAVPGSTSAPKLQPIITRIIMLQSGMRAPMGVKVKGPGLATIEETGIAIAELLKEVPGVAPASVYAERNVGKPYLEIDIDRAAIARYGLQVQDVQQVIEAAIGGMTATTTVEGRERYPVRIRYQRELRGDIDALGRIAVPAGNGAQVPLIQLAGIRYVRGPQMIRSEDTFLTGYVTFDKEAGFAEVDVVEACQAYLRHAVESGRLRVPAGASYVFAGNYENQIHAQRTLSIVMPLSLLVIFVILYLQFRDTLTTFMVFSSIILAWSGGFIMIWLYQQSWFLDASVWDVELRELFQIQPVLLSVALWVGFLALFGIAEDDGVVIGTYLQQSFARYDTSTVAGIRHAVLDAGKRRIRPCLMTTGTTILALLPVFTSSGRGSDVMIPMAIPSFGGMTIQLMTLFLVPVLYCLREEMRLHWSNRRARGAATERH